jgi:hypothetical protein
MKTAFLLSVAIGIVTVVAVGIVWGVLGAAGLWDSVNSIVQDSIGDSSGAPFEIQKYLGTSRVLGFTMIVAVVARSVERAVEEVDDEAADEAEDVDAGSGVEAADAADISGEVDPDATIGDGTASEPEED